MHLSRAGISVAVGISAALWALHLFLFESRLPSWSDLAPFSFVVGGLVLIGVLFEHQLWRVGVIARFVKRPDLRGTWEGELVSLYEDPKTGKRIPPKICYLAVKQCYSRLQLRQLTDESESWLIADDIRESEKGDGYQIVGVYTNKPGAEVRDRSQIHYGALLLDTHGSARKPTSLTGEYWTDRETKGRLTFSRKIDKLHSRFDEAASEFET